MRIRRNSGFVVAITTDGYIVMGKRSDNFQLELPGGGFELEQLSPVEAAIQEALEEVNLRIDPKKLIYIGNLGQRIRIEPEVYDQGIVFLYCIQLTQSKADLLPILKPSGKPNEPIGVEFVTLEEVLNDSVERIMLGHRRMTIYAFKKRKKNGWLGRLKNKVRFRNKTI